MIIIHAIIEDDIIINETGGEVIQKVPRELIIL